VQDDLGRRFSLEQIAGRLRRRLPDEPEMWLSAGTFYQSLYVQSRGALRRELTHYLRAPAGRCASRAAWRDSAARIRRSPCGHSVGSDCVSCVRHQVQRRPTRSVVTISVSMLVLGDYPESDSRAVR
jgi:hypothetical protein